MPIITPAYPSMCATYNITKSAMTIIQQELQRGSEITDGVLLSKQPWSDLFVKHTFFTEGYKYYISVITSSKTKEAHKVWSGYVESKVRVLVQGLEQHQSIQLARPFNKGYDRRHKCHNEHEVALVQDGDLGFLVHETDTAVASDGVQNGSHEEPEPPLAKSEPGAAIKPGGGEEGSGPSLSDIPEAPPKLEQDAAANASAPDVVDIYTTTHYIGLQLKDGAFPSEGQIDTSLFIFDLVPFPSLSCQANCSGAKSLDLSYQVDNFKQLCTAWDKYKDLSDLSCLSIQHVRK